MGGEIYEWCPFHPDGTGKPPHSPSLRLNRDKEVWYCDPCSEGGTLTDLAKRLGLQVNGQHEAGIIAVYDYLDEHGKLWGQVCRKAGKEFPVRRPDGSGGWIWGWTDKDTRQPLVTRTLYRLPGLLAADPATWVFVVEGEKDSDRLTVMGLVATTNPGGAGKWQDEYSDTLKGRKVAVIPDHDDAGLRHAEQVANSLADKAEVRIVELHGQRVGDDVSDWLDRGGTAEALLAKVEDSVLFSPTLRDGPLKENKFFTAVELMRDAPEETDFLVKPWIVVGSMTMVSGKPKLAGKTTWTLYLVRAVLEGTDFMGEPVEQGSVVYLTEERKATFRDALQRIGLTHHENLVIRQFDPADDWPTVAHEALMEARRISARLLVVDTLPQFARLAGDNENAAGFARDALAPLSKAEDLGIIIEFHDRKSGGDPGDSTRGSSAFGGAVDIIVDIKRMGGDGQERRREFACVGRFGDLPDKVIGELRDDGYHLLGDVRDVAIRDAKDAIRAVLLISSQRIGEGPVEENKTSGMTEAAIAEEVGPEIKKTTAGKALREMYKAGEVKREGSGGRGGAFTYFLSSPSVEEGS